VTMDTDNDKEERMSHRGGTQYARLLGIGLVLVAIVAVSFAGSARARSQACGNVVLNEQAWAGSTANTYVAKYVLEKKLGCKVKITKITEGLPSFQAMADGKIDLVLEDWQHVDQYKQYVAKAKTVLFAGANGVKGHIGWYIPTYLMQQHPEFKTWAGLKGKETLFKSPESGSQGMFLGGDPSYVQKDKELIKALGLNFKHVTAGAEPAQVARWTQLYKQKKPVIFYWYVPQYLNAQYQLSEVKLPARSKTCKDDAKAGGQISQYRCAYGVTIIMKLMSKKFATSGSPAVAFAKKWTWTNADQDFVARLIAGEHESPDKAAKKWIDAHPGKVKAWTS
jgi:glycine betaine/proline transport system substrate-binding protein